MSEEPEDYNAFGKWDAVGAAAMLGIFPAVLNFIFNDHDIAGTLSWSSVSVIAALAVYLLGIVVPERSLGRIVNLVGVVLTVVYGIIAYYMWSESVAELFPVEEPAVEPSPAAAPVSSPAESQ